MLDKIVESCRFLLNNYPEARTSKAYLDTRMNDKSQETFQFGYFPGVQNISVLTDLVGDDVLKTEKLLFTKDIEDSLFPRKVQFCYFEDHPLILPVRDQYGKTVGLIGRTFLSEEEWKARGIKSKYKNTEFKKGNFVFGLYENKRYILEQDAVIIVEGQYDVIKACEIGLKNIVAIGGSSLSLYQFSLISRYSNNMFLLLDNDLSGQKGRKQIINKFGNFANIRNLYLPDHYKDIDEYITNGGISDKEELSFSIEG